MMETKQAQELNSSPTFESILAFSKRVSLPERLIRAMVKQGQLPHVKSGTRVKIHIEAALEAIKKHSEKTAIEIAETMPVPLYTLKMPELQMQPRSDRKYRGRPPDAVRLGKLAK